MPDPFINPFKDNAKRPKPKPQPPAPTWEQGGPSGRQSGGAAADDLAAANAAGMSVQQWKAAYPTKTAQEAASGETTNAPPTKGGKGGGGKGGGSGGKTGATGVQPSTVAGSFEASPYVAPVESEISGMAGEYGNVMSSLNALPGDTSNDALGKATNATTSAMEGGEFGMTKALQGLQGAAATQAADLPYADVFSSLLTQKKNELLYGTTPTFHPSEQGWSSGLKDIYNYIATGTPAKGATGGPALGGGGTADTSALATVIGGGNASNPSGG